MSNPVLYRKLHDQFALETISDFLEIIALRKKAICLLA